MRQAPSEALSLVFSLWQTLPRPCNQRVCGYIEVGRDLFAPGRRTKALKVMKTLFDFEWNIAGALILAEAALPPARSRSNINMAGRESHCCMLLLLAGWLASKGAVAFLKQKLCQSFIYVTRQGCQLQQNVLHYSPPPPRVPFIYIVIAERERASERGIFSLHPISKQTAAASSLSSSGWRTFVPSAGTHTHTRPTKNCNMRKCRARVDKNAEVVGWGSLGHLAKFLVVRGSVQIDFAVSRFCSLENGFSNYLGGAYQLRKIRSHTAARAQKMRHWCWFFHWKAVTQFFHGKVSM